MFKNNIIMKIKALVFLISISFMANAFAVTNETNNYVISESVFYNVRH